MKIIAIGGGEIGRPGYPVETTKIDREIIKLTRKLNPKLLFLPTASSDNKDYVKVVHNHFGKTLGCKVDELYLLKQKLTKTELEEKVLSSDIVYVGGGDTLKMMNIWKKVGLDKILKLAAEKGIVLSGLSAGAICWFKYGSSDSRRFTNPEADLIKVSGLNFAPGLFCPHYDVEKDRKKDLKKLMRKTSGIAIAVENCCAIEIVDEQFRIITSKDTANAYKVFWKREKFFENKFNKNKWLKLSDFFNEK